MPRADRFQNTSVELTHDQLYWLEQNAGKDGFPSRSQMIRDGVDILIAHLTGDQDRFITVLAALDYLYRRKGK